MIATPPTPPAAAPPPGQNGHLPHDEQLHGGDPLDYVSVSRLKSFLTCRLKFHFEKVLALPKPTGPSLHFGKAIHAGLQHYNKARWRGGASSETAVLAAFGKAFDQPEDRREVAFDSAEEKIELRAKGEKGNLPLLPGRTQACMGCSTASSAWPAEVEALRGVSTFSNALVQVRFLTINHLNAGAPRITTLYPQPPA